MRTAVRGESKRWSPSGRVARVGARTYGRALAGAGGRALKAFDDGRDRGSPLVVVYAAPPYVLSVPSMPAARLAVNLTPSRVSGGIVGEHSRTFDARRHSLFMTPPSAPVVWRKESPSRHLLIYFHPGMLRGDDDGQSAHLGVPTLFNAVVPGLHRLVDDLVEELLTPGLLGNEVADSLARLVLVAVARHLDRTPAPSRMLTPAALARLHDYVMANLAERMLVADLAREVGMSADRFASEFTQIAGQPPHRYLLSLRIEHARKLLDTTSHSLVEIANLCGFASQQHMTYAIRRRLGTTPRRYRLLAGHRDDD